MLKKLHIAIILLFATLTACTTTHSPNTTKSQENDKKIKTALINTQLGLSYLQRHDLQTAKQKLLLALKEGPTIPEPWYAMGYYLEITGNTTEAGQFYKKAITLAPANGEAHNNYGTYLCRTGNYSAAISNFMEAVQDPQYLDNASAYENAGLCALKIPDRKLAISYFNRALQQDPNLPTSLIELAQFEYQQKNYTAAKEHLRQFLTIAKPNDQSRILSAQLGEKLGYLNSTSPNHLQSLQTPDTLGDVRWS
jgi:type IV pilus assembly protein PilF